MDSGLKYLIQNRAREWVRMVDGDTGKITDLIEAMGNDLDQMLNEFARTDNFQLILKANEQK